jgi:hypothetical protein
MNALRSDRGIATAPPRDQKCSCDGGGWIVTLDRDRYKAPATSGMVRFARCICLDYAPSPARSGGAGAVWRRVSVIGGLRAKRLSSRRNT